MKYYVALFQKIKEYYRTQSTNPAEIALICPNLRVYEDSEMKLLLPQMLISEELRGEALLKKQDISYQLNSLPSSDQYWDINPGNSLFNAYAKILSATQEISVKEDDIETKNAENLLYDSTGKPTMERKSYDKYLELFENVLAEWKDHVSKYNESLTDNERAIWLENLNLILLKKEKVIVDHKLLGHKKIIEDAFSKINKLDGFNVFLSNLNNSRSIFENAQRTDIQSLASYYDINFVPYDFMSNNNGWTRLTLDKKELDDLFEVAKVQNDFPEEIISIDYDEKNIEGIELEFSIVSMQRNWFSLSPIISSYFKWDDPTPISDGNAISIDYLLPAYPKKLILIKNLKINIGPEVKPDDVSNTNQLIYFGPIILKNQLFTNQKTSTKFLKATTNKEIIKSDQLHYLKKKGIETNQLTNAPKAVVVNDHRTDEPAKIPDVATANPIMRNMVFFKAPIRPNPIVAESAEIKHTFNQPLMATLSVNPKLFTTVALDPPANKASVFFAITDKLTSDAVYKCSISIKGSNNNHIFDIETDSDGLVNFEIPFGSYDLECRADGYQEYKATFKVENTSNLSLSYLLERDEVVFKSYFLIGMICEKLPKIPQVKPTL